MTGRSEDLQLLQEMQDEHAGLDELLERVEVAMREQASDLPEHIRALAGSLEGHLAHEEDQALPLIQAVLTNADWGGFKTAMARAQGIRGASVYVPWVIDGQPEADQRRFLAKMPPPLRLINRLSWSARYRRLGLWMP